MLKDFPRYQYDIFFIHLRKKMIFHLYDDRGCDVISTNLSTLLPLYHQYNAWILDYDREAIDQMVLNNG
ncbi:DUF3885 domain-containing protein [Paenibacillus shirakamiensis]|uniref:DUF3885 domain-containing protein n=1 Tax=Paenibacillus shirakamiensis TaxID=1265935 RepID=UPI003CC93B82